MNQNPTTCAPDVQDEGWPLNPSPAETIAEGRSPAPFAEVQARTPTPWREYCPEPVIRNLEFRWTDEGRKFDRLDLHRCHCGCTPVLVQDFHHDEQDPTALIYPVTKSYQVHCGNDRCSNRTPWLPSMEESIHVWQLSAKLSQ